MSRHFLFFAFAVAAYVPLVLLLDGPGLLTQLTLGATTAVFLFAATRGGPVPAPPIVTAIVVAAAGECLLSLGWGLYSYRNALIPIYVFFGHGIFYALAAESAQQPALQRIAPMITRGVLVAGSVMSVSGLLLFNDEWGLIWWLVAAALIALAQNSLLLSTCFVYTMLLEWAGTAIGNWRWAPEVPYAGVTSANPPSGVGLLYVLLDMMVVAITAWAADASRRRALVRDATATAH